MKLASIISEIQFFTYEGMVKVVFADEGANKIAELIRALPGVTTVTLAGDEGKGRQVLKIKLISQKTGTEAFEAMKNNALTKYPPIKGMKVATNTIEKK